MPQTWLRVAAVPLAFLLGFACRPKAGNAVEPLSPKTRTLVGVPRRIHVLIEDPSRSSAALLPTREQMQSDVYEELKKAGFTPLDTLDSPLFTSTLYFNLNGRQLFEKQDVCHYSLLLELKDGC